MIAFGLLIALVVYLFQSSKKQNPVQAEFEEIIQATYQGVLKPDKAAQRIKKLPANCYPLIIKKIDEADSLWNKIGATFKDTVSRTAQGDTSRRLTPAEARIKAKAILTYLLYIEDDVLKISELLEDTHAEIRLEACEALAAKSTQNKPLPYELLAKRLNDHDPVVQSTILRLLSKIGIKGRFAESSITKLLNHEDEEIALEAAKTILAIGGNTNAVMKSLKGQLSSESAEIQCQAAGVILGLQPDHSEAINTLMTNLRSSKELILKADALSTLCLAGTNAMQYSAEVKALFRYSDKLIREEATNTFYAITPNVVNDRPAIMTRSRHPKARPASP